ncbi:MULTISPECIES: hypothetical protein [Chryseobacterium]|jgi:hypothetical protein|uniref:Neutral ceramidase superfamily lipid hydrolase n=1 Tax=Chryseobacterium geocarposphaerae TaxID=1416776 RepID=A0ABU1LIF8_9FLAO|nr:MULTISPECIES: hypothetical protein [Chryseobacterium]ALR31627.1 hypothetical protein ATE47_14415 [Chryseobacterium sp. IHB B 17019]MDR6406488.1 putative neutral ceramidase superfamily lipid hydrolase [Chryseobacterium geocarposphaerae]MDR6699924.1 putative neutral ceramidase superfamily lipid hydrolase [Chryseobacterium ginsenosidimutans]
MTDFQKMVYESMYIAEGLAAVISLIFYKRIKDQSWKYFVFYLIFIFLCESIGKWAGYLIDYNKQAFFNYFVIPVQFIFFYWLYAAKSFRRPKLFIILSLVYLLSFIPSELLFSSDKVMLSLNYTLGCLILMILVVMEYYKQINDSEILNFDKNRMFYINLGVTLFYIGTLPFWTFLELIRPYREIFNIYFAYFLISGILMYLLFSISFIWGKQSS